MALPCQETRTPNADSLTDRLLNATAQTSEGGSPGISSGSLTERMGLTDLRQLAEIEAVDYADLAGSTVTVDFHNWLYRYLTIFAKFTDETAYTTSDGQEVANLLGIVKGLPKFYEHELDPVFVFDGEVLELKEDELARRREKKQEAAERLEEAAAAGDEEAVRSLRARTQRLTPTILETSRALFELLDVPIVDAPAEAEAQAAHMARSEIVDYVGTEDYDAILFGAPLALRQLTSSGPPECMDLEATLAELGLTREQLVDIAILCGTDYNDGVHGIGPKTALKKLSSGLTLEEVLEERDTTIEHLDAIRRIYLEPDVNDVTNIDWDWTPDLETAESYLVDEWEIPVERIETAMDRIEAATQ